MHFLINITFKRGKERLKGSDFIDITALFHSIFCVYRDHIRTARGVSEIHKAAEQYIQIRGTDSVFVINLPDIQIKSRASPNKGQMLCSSV